jgi:predicted PurR-regulated permease PerM
MEKQVTLILIIAVVGAIVLYNLARWIRHSGNDLGVILLAALIAVCVLAGLFAAVGMMGGMP